MDVTYFIFIFISPSVPRSSIKMPAKQLIKTKRPYSSILLITVNLFHSDLDLERTMIQWSELNYNYMCFVVIAVMALLSK